MSHVGETESGLAIEPIPSAGPNPFRGSVVADAWGKTPDQADVGQIHGDVFSTCLKAIEQARHGASSAGVVIYGEAGSGKTHLIGRLRRRLTDSNEQPTLERLSQAFAYVRLNANPSSLFRHVRQRVVEDLLRKPPRGVSQLERMLLTRLMDADGGGGDIRQWWDYALDERRDELPGLIEDFGAGENLSPDFIRAMTCVVLRQHRLDATSWMRGDSLSEASSARLQIAAPVDGDLETESRRVLVDFVRLAGSQVPLVICFDQVEALQSRLDDTESLFKYSQLVTDLHDADTNLVLISSMQSSLLKYLSTAVPNYANHRLGSFASTSLQPLGFELAKQLLLHRLDGFSTLAPNGTSGSLDPLTDADVRTLVGRLGCTPRALLDGAARLWDMKHGEGTPPPPLPPLDRRLDDEWQDRLEARRLANRNEDTEEILRDGVPRLVTVVEDGWTATDGKDVGGLDYILAAPKQEARVGVKILQAEGRRLATQLQRIVEAREKSAKFERIVLLRDERLPIGRTAVKTREYLTELEKNEGVLAWVNPEAVAALDALRRLLADAASGDLDLSGEQVDQPTVLDWLRRNLPMPLRELADFVVAPSVEVDGGPTLVCERLQEYLSESPLASVDEAARAIDEPADRILAAAGERTDLFGLVRGDSAVIFSARHGSRCLSASDGE